MGTPVHEDSLLTVSQVAQRLTVSAKTVRRLVERGELPALRIGSSVRVDPDELRTWLYDVATARDGRTARVDGVTYRAGVNGIRTAVAPSALAEVDLGFWAEEQLGPSVVSRRWVEPRSSEGMRVAAAMNASPTKTAPAVKEEPAKAEPVIVITDVALESMASELFWSTRLDGCETGGCLYGRTKGNIVTITRATGPGKKAERGKFRLKIDDVMSHNWEIEDSVEVGLWHSHPNGDSRPSRADRMAWLSGFARCGKETKLGAYAALIFSDPEETNWVNPQVHGWVLDVRENGDPRLSDAKMKPSL
jgi:excisionase family DNA binding protein